MPYLRVRCPKCNNRISYIRITSGEGVCHQCGVISVKDTQQAREEAEKRNQE